GPDHVGGRHAAARGQLLRGAVRAPAHPAEVLGVPELLRDVVPRASVTPRAAARLPRDVARGFQARGVRAGAQAPAQDGTEETMKGVVFLGDRKLELREFADPTPGPRDVVLEIKASGMCGSDLHNYRAPAQPAGAVTGGIQRKAGVIAGHEPCGIVAAVGAGVTGQEAGGWPRGVGLHYQGVGVCEDCRAGAVRTWVTGRRRS